MIRIGDYDFPAGFRNLVIYEGAKMREILALW